MKRTGYITHKQFVYLRNTTPPEEIMRGMVHEYSEQELNRRAVLMFGRVCYHDGDSKKEVLRQMDRAAAQYGIKNINPKKLWKLVTE